MKYELHPLNAGEKQLMKAAQKGPADYHVKHTGAVWSVSRADAAKATAIYVTKAEAVAHARKLAASQQVGMKIYNMNGKRAR